MLLKLRRHFLFDEHFWQRIATAAASQLVENTGEFWKPR